jgi:hypothetical protein
MGKRRQVRRIHLNGDVWRYVVGSSFVCIRDPQNRSTHIHKDKLGDYCDNTLDYAVTPGSVKAYIAKVIHPGNLIPVPLNYEQTKEILLNFYGYDRHAAGN